jgi:hypothetical protein
MRKGTRVALAIEKQACRVACCAARKADQALAALLDRFYCETLFVVDGAPVPAKVEMRRRLRILSRIIQDRTGWHRRGDGEALTPETMPPN